MLMACACLLLGAPAFYVGNQTTSLGSDTGIRFPSAGGGCPALPGSPAVHYAARLEAAYADGDPVSSATDQGSFGSSATQAVGSAQPTFVASCVNGLPCYDGDGGDYLVSSFSVNQAQPSLICGVVRNDVPTNQNWYWSSQTTGTRQELAIVVAGADDYTAFAGTSLDSLVEPGVGEYDYVCVTYNGASSNIRVNGSSAATGNAGTEDLDGFTLLARYGGNLNLNGAIAELIYYNSAQDAAGVESVIECLYGTTWPQ
jgi:hypothetical protein